MWFVYFTIFFLLHHGKRVQVKDDQLYIDERAVIWGERAGEGLDVTVPVLIRGQHQFPFRFNIPETNLPCSFESRACYIRYFVKVCMWVYGMLDQMWEHVKQTEILDKARQISLPWANTLLRLSELNLPRHSPRTATGSHWKLFAITRHVVGGVIS